MSSHALLSPSSAHRWLRCTPSARAEAEYPETTSEYAEEGRRVHEISAIFIKALLKSDMLTSALTLMFCKSEEERDAILSYAAEVVATIEELLRGEGSGTRVDSVIERTLPIDGIPEGRGTPDFAAYNHDDMLAVLDFKYGKGIKVMAEDNAQLMLYACAVLDKFDAWDSVERVILKIVQPRLNHIDTAEYTPAELKEFMTHVREKATLAYEGRGERCTGEHCKYCRALPLCPQIEKEVEKMEEVIRKKPEELNTDEIAPLLEKCDVIAAWAKRAREFALGKCLKGENIKGLKAVEGRSMREWTDESAALKTLIDSGVDEAKIYQRAPLSLAKLEKLLGKKEFSDLVGEYVTRGIGKPTLVSADDSRPAITANSAAEAFK